MIFDLLETKRKHVKKYLDTIPDKKLIENALWKAWKTTPSKNNFMAYQLDVYGPDKEMEKEIMWNFAVANHINAGDVAVEKGFADKTQEGTPNPYYEHIAFNPYLFTIHSRVSNPNNFYKKQIKEGHFYEQAYEELFERIIDSVAVEVGHFSSNLGYYLLEEGLDISYNSCFRRRPEEWHKVGLDMVKTRPIAMISCGYAGRYRRQDLKRRGIEEDDRRPEIDEIVKWM